MYSTPARPSRKIPRLNNRLNEVAIVHTSVLPLRAVPKDAKPEQGTGGQAAKSGITLKYFESQMAEDSMILTFCS